MAMKFQPDDIYIQMFSYKNSIVIFASFYFPYKILMKYKTQNDYHPIASMAFFACFISMNSNFLQTR